MAKRLVAKVGEYQKDGQTKGEYVKIGVILENQNGEYLLIDPSVSLSGILAKQNVMAANAGQPMRDNVMAGIFTDQNQGQQGCSNQGGQNRNGQQGYNQQQGSQQRRSNPPANNYQQSPAPDFDFDDD